MEGRELEGRLLAMTSYWDIHPAIVMATYSNSIFELVGETRGCCRGREAASGEVGCSSPEGVAREERSHLEDSTGH